MLVRARSAATFLGLAGLLTGCAPSGGTPATRDAESETRSPTPHEPQALDDQPVQADGPVPVRYPGPCFTEYRSHQLTQRTTYAYDGAGRVVERRFSGGNDDRVDTFSYDAEGRLRSVKIENRGPNPYVQHERIHFGANGRRIRTDKWNRGSTPQWQTLEQYDDEGRLRSRQSVTVTSGRVSFRRRFVYEGDRLVKEEVDNRGKRDFPLTVVYRHDTEGRIDRKWEEWDDRPSPSAEEWFTYDDRGRLQERGDALSSKRLERDTAGNVTAIEHRSASGEPTARVVYDYGCWEGRDVPAGAPTLVPHASIVTLDDVPVVTL